MSNGGLRDPRVYAELDGVTYLANSRFDRTTNTTLVLLTAPDGPAPAGFTVSPGRWPTRDVEQSEVDRLYRVRYTCLYRGGGPFDVLRLDRRAEDTWLHVLYSSDDRDWALAQPGIASDPNRRAVHEPDVEGVIPLSEAEFLQQFEDELIQPRRHGPVA